MSFAFEISTYLEYFILLDSAKRLRRKPLHIVNVPYSMREYQK